jgi:hypothetical protein
MRRPRSKLVGIGELIPKVYPSSEPEEAKALRVFAAYCKSVSERVLKNARPVRFYDGVLTIHTSTATWANALSFEIPDLLADVRRRAKGVNVTRIAFRTGHLPELPKLPEPPPKLVPIALHELPDQVARELAGIGDDTLRDAVTRAAVTALSLESTMAPLHRRKKR